MSESPTPAPAPEEWLPLYGDYLYRYALSRLRDRGQAEDAVQETLLSAFKARDRYDGRVEMRFWLRAIMRNKIIDTLRKRVKDCSYEAFQQEPDSPGFLERFTGILPGRVEKWTFDPQVACERSDFWEQFNRCIEKIPEPGRSLFIMREIEEQDTEEICKDMKISANHLWVIIHRVRKSLKLCLNKNYSRRPEF
jgi:RNA polymerase sigma-70 factor (TIGR02943 family)